MVRLANHRQRHADGNHRFFTVLPLGMLLGGILTEEFGTFPLLIGLGIAYFATTLSMAFIPTMREMDRV